MLSHSGELSHQILKLKRDIKIRSTQKAQKKNCILRACSKWMPLFLNFRRTKI